MRVIFLDIDGVLNTHDFCPRAQCGPIHRDKVDRLNFVIATTGSKVVLSSAWRYLVHRGEMNLVGLDWLLRSHGIVSGCLIGITRTDTMVERPHWDGSTPWPVSNERGDQIRDWLVANTVERFVAVDDLDLGISAAGIPLVRTQGNRGLTDDESLSIIRVLEAAS